jgi:nucleobase transporter 1/2
MIEIAGQLLTNFFLSIAALLVFYGIQHYLSIAGSLVFIPLILVPTMGGSDV